MATQEPPADPEASTTYTYDRLSRLIEVDADGDLTSYLYDPVGNRLERTRDGSPVIYGYDRADRITSAGGVGYTVDANGKLVARGADTFGYDQANRLTSATVDSTTSTYTWDGDGKRASSTVASLATSYVYDVNQALPVVLADGERKYVWGLGLAYAVDGSDNLEVYHTDGPGSVRAITDANGEVIQTYRTDEFGIPDPAGTQDALGQPFQYTGEQQDAETGLVYLRARHYDPAIGRFVQRDPFAGFASNPLSLNRYSYVENDPVNLTDPSGENPLLFACAGGALANVAIDLGMAWASGDKVSGSQVLRSAAGGCASGLVGFGAGALVGRVVVHAATKGAGAASNAANAARLSAQLTRHEAASVFTRSGGLRPEVIQGSRMIIRGDRLRNPDVIRELTADGSSITDWAKYTTQVFKSPSGPFQVHYYRNRATGAVNYNIDYKTVFVGGGP